MELKEAIHARRAVREFSTEPVEQSTLRWLVEEAIQAPSAVNEQPWSFCIVRDKAVLAGYRIRRKRICSQLRRQGCLHTIFKG